MSTISQQVTPPQGPHAKDALLTVAEVADVLRVPIATLRYWRHLGTGPRSFRVGRGVRYWRNEVTSWLQSQSDGPPPHESSASERECRSDVLRRRYEHSRRGCRAAGQPRARGGSPGLIGGPPSGDE